MSEPSFVPRRSFVARVAAAAATFGAVTEMPAIFAGTRGHESPASDLDAWFKGMRGPERVFYDCTSAASAPDGILFARNFLKFSAEKLGTKDSEMGVIVSFRHFATPYGYNDAIWAKYPQMAEMLKVNDPKTSKPAARNIPLHDEMDGFPGSSLPALLSHGVQFAVCGAATSFIAGLLAGPNGNAKAIEDEILANLIPGAKTMPAGVVAVQRAQKAGFAYTFVG